ncbi:MAG: undecaprenyl-diphosphate phosphatase [Neomegalonema sp.]|nr:undecaprenyl-diphosphate phosphatase [Neomegalonema sp.]
MENVLELAVLAVVQGITEFLPISSTAHLLLARQVMNFKLGAGPGTVIDIALHFGSLFAVLFYFWRDVKAAVIGPFTLISDMRAGRELRWSSRLALMLIVATIPLIAFSLLLSALGLLDFIRDDKDIQIIKIIGWTTLIFGVTLYLADKYGKSTYEAKDWGWMGAIWMGVAQALSIIPGTSRSGATMMMARILGFDRQDGARVALLMSVPAITAAAAYTTLKLIKANLAEPGQLEAGDKALSLACVDAGVLTQQAIFGALLAFISAYIALMFLMRWLAKSTFTPFAVYRLILGVFLLGLAYGGFISNSAEATPPLTDPCAIEGPAAK